MRKFPTLARLLSAAGLLALLPLGGWAQYTAGNLVVFRAGDGTQTQTANGNSAFLDEFAPTGAGQTPVNSLALPTTVSGANKQLLTNGSSTSEGQLNRSVDGQYLIAAGYAANLGGATSLQAATSVVVPRTIGTISGARVINTTTSLTDYSSGNTPRSAASVDGSAFFAVGGAGATRYATLGSTTSTQLNTTPTNIRVAQIFGSNVYFSTGSGTTGVYLLGPTSTITGTQTPVLITAVPSPYGFFFADLDGTVAGLDVLYVADDNNTVNGGIRKYSNVGGVYTLTGVITIPGATMGTFLGARGLTASVSGTTVTLYATTTATSGNTLVQLTDASGYNAMPATAPTVTILATAAANTAFRGVAFAPVSATPANTALTISNGTFSSTAANTSSTSTNFTLSNSGATAQTVTLTTSGAPFSYSGGTISVPAAAMGTPGTATFTLTFAPTAAGTFTGTVSAAVSGFLPVTSTSFSGTATAPANNALTITTGTFPSTAAGATSSSTGFALNNSSGAAQSVTLSTSGAPFSLGTTAYTVPAGGSVPVTVTFSPTAAGTFTGTLTAVVSGFQNVTSGSYSATATTAVPTATNYSVTSLLAGIMSTEVVSGTNLTSANVTITGNTAGTVTVGTVVVGGTGGTSATFTLLATQAGSFTLNVTTPGGTLTQPITVTTPPTGFFEPFESGTKSAYGSAPVTLSTGAWTFSEAVLGNQAPTAGTPGSGEKKNNGQAARLRTLGSIYMNFDKLGGVGDISFVAALYGTDAAQVMPASSVLVEVSTNGGGAYTTVGSITPTATLSAYSFTSLNQAGPVRFRFTSNTTGTTPRIDIDDVAITDFGPAGDLTVSGTQNVSGTYNNVTIASGGTANVTSALVVNGILTVQNGGTLNTNCQSVGGAGSFDLQAGGALGICSATGITPSGASGAVQLTPRSFSTDASYIYNGTVPQTSGSGLPSQVRNLTVNNTAPLTTNRTLTLSAPVAVSQLVRLQSGSLASGGNLTLRSVKGQGTALVDNTGGTVTGTATMQRAVDILTPDNLGYHHYSSPVATTPIDDLQTPGFDFVLNPAYNTAVSATQVRPFPTVFGYDERRMTPANGLTGTAASSVATDLSMFDKGFFSPTSGDAMTLLRGYTANVPNALLVDFTGTLNTGSVSISGLTRGADAQAGYHLLGNPYPSPINASGLAAVATNLNTAVYVFHATSRYSGNYSTYLSTLAVGVGNSTARSADAPSSIIPAGVGFFMQVTAPNSSTGALALTNANRVTTFNASAQPAFGRQTTASSTLTLALAGAGLTDHATVYLNAQATAGVDAAYDAAKLPNTNGLNLAVLAGTAQLAIDGRPAPTTATVLPLFLGVPATGTYTLRTAQLTGFGTTTVYLRDALTGTRTLLNGSSSYSFVMSGYNAPGRFALEFAPAGTALATAGQALAAQVQLYPNPAQGRFHVVLPAGTKAASAIVTNALGQVVLTRTLAGNEADFSIATPGVYTLRLVVDGNAVTRKVVVE